MRDQTHQPTFGWLVNNDGHPGLTALQQFLASGDTKLTLQRFTAVTRKTSLFQNWSNGLREQCRAKFHSLNVVRRELSFCFVATDTGCHEQNQPGDTYDVFHYDS